MVTCLDDDARAGALGALSAEEGDVGSLKNADSGTRCISHSQEIVRLTGERSVVHLHLFRREQHDVGGDLRASRNVDDVARHDLFRFDLLLLTITCNFSMLRDEVLEVFHEGGGLRGLAVRKDARGEHDNGQYDTQVEI